MLQSKSNCTINPSPRHHPANVAPNVVSPMSPAVPSPLCHPGPSPVNSINGAEQVSSSTQVRQSTDIISKVHSVQNRIICPEISFKAG